MTTTIRVQDGDTITRIEVPSADVRDVRPLRVSDCLTVETRETSAAERELVCDRPYAATWLGWNHGQCPAYGRTAESAACALAAGRFSD